MNQPICPQCQSPIPPDAPGGLCPSCLLLGAAGRTESAPAGMAHAPSIEEIRAAFPELEVLEMFGHGGMGVVFKARQPRLDRLVALKILPPALARQPGFAERFTREARALARLSHPHIVAVFDFGERAGFFYLLMEFVNGVNLRQAIRAGVKPEQALTLVPKICEALQFAHDHGVLHRDIKPENILLDVAGIPKLADFGIAKLAGEPGSAPDLTLTGASLGTAAYMAPEQIEHPAEVDHRADIYSLGVVLYEMLTGELPLGRFAAPSAKANVAKGVDEVVFRALEKERGLRQQSATEMKTEVDHVRTAAASADAARAGHASEPEMDHEWSPGIIRQILLVLVVLSAMAIPLSAVAMPVRELVSPATLAVLTGVFGALYGIWPGGQWRTGRKTATGATSGGGAPVPNYSSHGDDEWILRCPACGHSRSLTSAGGVRIGAASIGKRVRSSCSQCGFVGMVDLIQARDAKAQRFVPNPAAAQDQARTLALWGAWLNLVPLVLAICFTPLWLKIYDLQDANARFPEALRPHMGALLSFAIPSGVAILVGFIFTVIVLFGFRYRAKWYFWWMMIYGAALAGFFGLGVVFIAFCLLRSREFFPESIDGTTSPKPPGNPAVAWLGVLLSLVCTFGIIFGLIRHGEREAETRKAQMDAVVAARQADAEEAERYAVKDSPMAIKARAAADRALKEARAEQRRVYTDTQNARPLILAPAVGVFGFLLAIFFATKAIISRPRTPRPPDYNPWPRRIFWLFIGFVVVPVILIAIALFAPAFTAIRNGHPSRITSYERAAASVVVTADHAPFAGQLGGGTVELVAVSQHPSDDLPWWQMDGMATKEGPFVNSGPRNFAGRGERAYEFIFRTHDLPSGASLPQWEIEGFSRASGGGIPALRSKPSELLPGHFTITASLPESLDRANIKIGCAYEEWRTLSENAVNNALGITVESGGVRWSITHGTGVETKAGELMVTFTNTSEPGFQVRVAAVKKDGTEIGNARLSRINEQSEWYFAGLPLAEVQSFRFQVRRIRWIEFRGIALSPIERTLERSSPTDAANALYEEGIRLARERLDSMRKRVEVGLGTQIDVDLAERDLNIAEARGNPLLIAQARERYAAELARVMEIRLRTGQSSQEERDSAQKELNEARLELEKARAPGPKTQP